MSIFSKKTILTLLSGAFCFALAAQDANGIGWKDYDYIKQSDMRLTSYNAAGLRYLLVDRLASASVYANKSNGSFINYNQSDNSYFFGAQTESFFRLSPKVVFFGSISYDNFTGRNMGGSAFINPYYQPFDIVEYADTTRGKKNLETYHLTGAVCVDLTDRLTFGGKIDYQAANYAKQKDLRHKNRLLDMYATAGLTYRILPSVEIGANYYYRRSVEGLVFSVYGTTDRAYHSLIDYGAFFGKTELYEEAGYTQKNENNPMYNNFHGASLQLNAYLLPQLRFFNEFTYKSRDGEYGKRSPNKVVYSEHQSDIFGYNGALTYQQEQTYHQLNIQIESESLENFENVYKHETQPGGTTIVVYYDPLKVSDKEWFRLNAEYAAHLGVRDFCPVWTFRGGVDFHQNKVTASFYPFYRKQTIRYIGIYAGGLRNLVNGKNKYTFSLDARYTSGGGTMYKDGEYATPGENQTRPRYSETNLQNEYEYLTTGQLKGDIGLKYARLFNHPGLQGFVALHYNLKKGFDVEYLSGDDFHSVTFTVGCVF